MLYDIMDYRYGNIRISMTGCQEFELAGQGGQYIHPACIVIGVFK